MNATNIIEALPVLVLLLVVLAVRWYRFFPLQEMLEAVRQFKDELLGRKPVYSAETTRAREAEFIRDQLPKGHTGLWLVTVVGLFGAMIWVLVR